MENCGAAMKGIKGKLARMVRDNAEMALSVTASRIEWQNAVNSRLAGESIRIWHYDVLKENKGLPAWWSNDIEIALRNWVSFCFIRLVS